MVDIKMASLQRKFNFVYQFRVNILSKYKNIEELYWLLTRTYIVQPYRYLHNITHSSLTTTFKGGIRVYLRSSLDIVIHQIDTVQAYTDKHSFALVSSDIWSDNHCIAAASADYISQGYLLGRHAQRDGSHVHHFVALHAWETEVETW